ncbi:MAG: hypothetical protein A2017_15470 [Lentisphaerae bacterium GWF2_44_16]|nr:MAG: hypothetical protein A2017_15470 [Lentisphaerae bacterium GWF2_44_16]
MDFKKKRDAKKAGSKSGRKRTVILVSIASFLGICCAGYYAFNRPVPPAIDKQSSDEMVKYLASPEFAKLPEEVKKNYFKGVNEKFDDEGKSIRGEASNLADGDRQQLRDNTEKLLRAMFQERIDKYFALPKEERVAYLDKVIDEMQKRREERQKAREKSGNDKPQNANNQQGNNRQRNPARGLERAKKRIESNDSTTRAKQVQFFKDLRARSAERKK